MLYREYLKSFIGKEGTFDTFPKDEPGYELWINGRRGNDKAKILEVGEDFVVLQIKTEGGPYSSYKHVIPLSLFALMGV